MPLMGIREYGRHRNVSHVAVIKALRAGRIRQNAEGLIDSVRADRDWASNTHPAPGAPRAVPAPVTDDSGFSRARTVRAHYEALQAKLEYERKSAELLDATEVKIAAYQVDQVFREHMSRIPDAVIARLQAHKTEHGSAPDEHGAYVILTDEIRTALEVFCDEVTAGAA
jgi:hypothetical protein